MCLLKKFKKLNIYMRVLIVYIIFLIIKWCCWKAMGVEVGVSKEGLDESNVSTLPDESEQLKKRKRLWIVIRKNQEHFLIQDHQKHF